MIGSGLRNVGWATQVVPVISEELTFSWWYEMTSECRHENSIKQGFENKIPEHSFIQFWAGCHDHDELGLEDWLLSQHRGKKAWKIFSALGPHLLWFIHPQPLAIMHLTASYLYLHMLSTHSSRQTVQLATTEPLDNLLVLSTTHSHLWTMEHVLPPMVRIKFRQFLSNCIPDAFRYEEELMQPELIWDA